MKFDEHFNTMLRGYNMYFHRPSLLVASPPHPHTDGDTPHPPTVGWGVGWGSHALLLTFILGLQQNTAFWRIWQHRVVQTCSKQGYGSFHAGFSFDFL